ncbi:MAG: ABC transporter permease [Brevinema sp.]
MRKIPNYLTSCFESNLPFLTALFVSMVLIFTIINPYGFLNFRNFSSIAFQFSELGFFAIAMCLAIVPGGIDLSIIAIANLSAVLMVLVFKALGETLPPHVLIPLMLAVGFSVGLVCGAINGLLIGYLDIPAMLATLVTMTLFTGLGVGITKGATVAGVPEQFLWIGIGSLWGIPIPLLIFSAVAFVISRLLMRHRFGWSLFLIGTNVKSTILTGVNHKKSLLYVHTLIGIIASIAGVVVLARTNSASSSYGNTYILSSILVVILGGVNILGGRGFFAGVVMAVVFLQVLSTGFNMVLQGVSGGNFFKDFIWGLLLIIMIFVNKHSLKLSSQWKKYFPIKK